MAKKIRLVVDQDRLRDILTVDELISIEDGSIAGAKAAIAAFMVDEKGNYVDEAIAKAQIGSMKVGELMDLIPSLRDAVQEGVSAGPLSESASTTSTDTE